MAPRRVPVILVKLKLSASRLERADLSIQNFKSSVVLIFNEWYEENKSKISMKTVPNNLSSRYMRLVKLSSKKY